MHRAETRWKLQHDLHEGWIGRRDAPCRDTLETNRLSHRRGRSGRRDAPCRDTLETVGQPLPRGCRRRDAPCRDTLETHGEVVVVVLRPQRCTVQRHAGNDTFRREGDARGPRRCTVQRHAGNGRSDLSNDFGAAEMHRAETRWKRRMNHSAARLGRRDAPCRDTLETARSSCALTHCGPQRCTVQRHAGNR